MIRRKGMGGGAQEAGGRGQRLEEEEREEDAEEPHDGQHPGNARSGIEPRRREEPVEGNQDELNNPLNGPKNGSDNVHGEGDLSRSVGD